MIEWNKAAQGYILSAFFVGYTLTQAVFGVLAGKYGGKRVLLAGTGVFTACTLLIPVASRFVEPSSKTKYPIQLLSIHYIKSFILLP